MASRFVTRFSRTGLEFRRLGMIRLVLTSGGQGSVDSIDVDGTELLDPDGGGADPITYATSLANFGKLIANKINAGTSLHGWQAKSGIISSLTEVIIYQTVPGAITGAVTVDVSAALGDDIVITRTVPTGATANTIYGDTDSWVDLPLSTRIAADDYAVRGLVRVKAGLHRKVEGIINLSPVALYYNAPSVDTAQRWKFDAFEQASSVINNLGLPLPANAPLELPVKDWHPANDAHLISVQAFNGVLDPQFAVLTR